jgi:methyl-accepting chemotaxis protein
VLAAYIRDPAHRKLINQNYKNIFVASSDNIGRVSTGIDIDLSGNEIQELMMAHFPSVYISDPRDSAADGSIVCNICEPVADAAGHSYGYISAALDIAKLQHIVNDIKIGKEGFAWLISSDGMVIAHNKDAGYNMKADFKNGDSLGYKGLSDLTAEMLKGRDGIKMIQDPSGKKNLVAYTAVQGTPWSLAIDIPESQLNTLSYKLRFTLALLLGTASILIIVISAGYITKSLRPLRTVTKSVNDIAEGDADLTKQIAVHTNDEIGSLVDGFNDFTQKLRAIVTGIKKSSSELIVVNDNLQKGTEKNSGSLEQILENIENTRQQIQQQTASVNETTASVTQIAHNINTLEDMIQNQAAGVTEASSAVEQMVGNITSVNKSIGTMASSFTDLQKHVETGVSQQINVNDRISLIKEQSKMLEDANTAIAGIAEQTNLLAMNAAIEAAHAGEAGKGFSVVADEIRKLSETSTAQSKSIGQELKKIQASIDEVVGASVLSSKTFGAVSEHIKTTDQIVQQIKEAMEEQQTGSAQIMESLKMMNDTTVSVRTASSEMASGNQAILVEIKKLQEATSAMRESIVGMSEKAGEIRTTGTNLKEVGRNMNTSIADIRAEIGKFIIEESDPGKESAADLSEN